MLIDANERTPADFGVGLQVRRNDLDPLNLASENSQKDDTTPSSIMAVLLNLLDKG